MSCAFPSLVLHLTLKCLKRLVDVFFLSVSMLNSTNKYTCGGRGFVGYKLIIRRSKAIWIMVPYDKSWLKI